MTSKLSAADATVYMHETFPDSAALPDITLMEHDRAVVRLVADDTHLRPGGYISGPTQMSLADSVAFYAIMTRIDFEPMAVTSNLNINFLRPCIGEVVIAEGRVMKLGRALAVVDVDIRIEGAAKASSQATVTYALPRKTSTT